MLRIRLWREGKRRRPLYRLVVTPKTTASQGAYKEAVGHYDPVTKSLNLQKERILYWLRIGAQPSNTASKLLSKAGLKHSLIVVKKFKAKSPKAKKEKEEKIVSPEKPSVQEEAEASKEEVKSEEKEKKPEEKEKIQENNLENQPK